MMKKMNGYLLSIIWKFDKRYFCLLPLIALGRVWNGILFMVFPKLIIDSMMQKEKPEIAIAYACMMGIGLLVGSLVSDVLEEYNENRVIYCKEWMVLQLQANMLKTEYANLEMPSYMDRYQKAFSVYSIWQADLQRGVNAFIQFLASVLSIIIAAGLLFSLNWTITLIVATIVVLSSMCNARAVKKMSELLMNFAPNVRKVSYFLGDLQERHYAKEIRVYHMQDWLGSHANRLLTSMIDGTIKAINKQISTETISITAGVVQECGAYLYVGWMALKGKITIGALSMYVSAINTFANSMKDAMTHYVVLKEMLIYYRDFWEFLYGTGQTESEVQNVKEEQLFDIKEPISIEVDHVWFRYPQSEQWILKDVCLQIRENDRISLVGDNGAGKTTLVKLLMGLYEPVSGEIRINGKKLKCYNREAYWKKIGVVFQDFKTLAFTIRENIVLGNVCDDRARLNLALHKSGLWEKVQTLHEKDETYLGKAYHEDGTEFSGGELQKLAIAQLWYKDAPVLILDEPTANLSPMEEYRIFHQFHEMAKGKTVVFISHRMSSCRLCDKIFVLNNGMICEQGTHEELMGKQGMYAEMFSLQAEYYV